MADQPIPKPLMAMPWAQVVVGLYTNTKASDGYSVGTSGGRRSTKQIAFDESIELPNEWDISQETLNLSEDLLSACARRVCQQHTFDSKSPGVGICYGCGHNILFTIVDNVHTFLIDKPSKTSQNRLHKNYLGCG